MEIELTELCQKTFGGAHEISNLRRLTGGANSAIWSFDYNGMPLILRQNAHDEAVADNTAAMPSITLRTEANLMKLAAGNGVKAPFIHAITDADSPLGEAVLMSRVEGEGLPQKLFRDPKYQNALSGLPLECAEAFAKIHAIPFDNLTDQLETRTPEDVLTGLKQLFSAFGQTSPVLAAAISWMETTCPDPVTPVLLHADFRMGNLLIDESGITAVLDWELAHIGDPVSDIAYICAPPWRFGNYDKQAGGFGSMTELVKNYEKASGRKVHPDRLLWWRMQSSVSWCLMCMIMANMWRTGSDRELERIVIGTRVSESEVDILLLFDEIYGFEDKLNLSYLNTITNPGKGETKPEELTQAISEWLTSDIIPHAGGREGFKARVARNAIGILQRESQLRPLFSKRCGTRLSGIDITADELCGQLLNGALNIQSARLRRHLKLTTMEQLSIDQPKYAGLKVAHESWSTQ